MKSEKNHMTQPYLGNSTENSDMAPDARTQALRSGDDSGRGRGNRKEGTCDSRGFRTRLARFGRSLIVMAVSVAMVPLAAVPAAWADDGASVDSEASSDASSAVMSVDDESRTMVQDFAARLDDVQELRQQESDRNAADSASSDQKAGGETDFSFGSSSQLSEEDVAEVNGSADSPGYGGASSLPKTYISPATSTKDQGSDGVCWSFSTTAALESSRLVQRGVQGTTNISAGITSNAKRTWPDYSEAQTVYSALHATASKKDYQKVGLGDSTNGFQTLGSFATTATALADWEGVVNESSAPFLTGTSPSTYSTMVNKAKNNAGKSVAHLESAEVLGAPWPVASSKRRNGRVYLTRNRNNAAFAVIKNAIKSKSGVITSFHAPDQWNSGRITKFQKKSNGSIDVSLANGNYVAGWTYNADAGDSQGSITTNHLVEVVGWDDGYNRFNFAQPLQPGDTYDSNAADKVSGTIVTYDGGHRVTSNSYVVPKHNGAWIIKNSWGSQIGLSGYQYISYDDKTFWNMYQYQLESVSRNKSDSQHEYNLLHQFDGTDSMSTLVSDGAVSEANIFTGQGEKVQAIGVWTRTANTTVSLEVRTGVKANAPGSGSKAASKTVTIGRAGYHTVWLDSSIYLSKGARFSVIASLKAKAKDPVNGVTGLNYAMTETGGSTGSVSQHVEVAAGQSFLKSNGKWMDVTALNAKGSGLSGYGITFGNVMLKALSVKVSVSSVSNPTVSTERGKAPTLPATVAVKWNDGTSGRVPVTWDKVPSSKYARVGSFTVNGKLTDGRKAHATVKVVPRTLTVAFDARGGTAVSSQRVKEGQKASRPKNPTLYGYSFVGWYTAKSGGSKYDFTKAVWSNTTLYAHWKVNPKQPTRSMYRLYNPNSGEHFYTANPTERATLKKVGWHDEGVGWVAPAKSSTPVYRMYNPNAGDHHYTMNASERDMLVRAGWKYEGIGWYSATNAGRKPVYREYNPNAKSGSHNYTLNWAEHKHLGAIGWSLEGVAWYAARG